MHPKIRTICQTWLDAVNQVRPEDMLALYGPVTVLLPTFSAHNILCTEHEIKHWQASGNISVPWPANLKQMG